MADEPLENAAHKPPKGDIKFPAGQHLVWLPIVLSIVIAGAGQLYNRQYLKAAFFAALAILAYSFLDRVAFLLLALYGIADARAIAMRLRRGQTVGKWQFF